MNVYKNPACFRLECQTVKNEGFDDVKEWAHKYLGLLQEKKMDVEEEMIILSDIIEKHNLGKE